MISKKVKQYANERGYDFFVNGLGHRTLAQVVTLDRSANNGKPSPVTWTANNSAAAIATIRNLVQQSQLPAKSNAEIASAADASRELITA